MFKNCPIKTQKINYFNTLSDVEKMLREVNELDELQESLEDLNKREEIKIDNLTAIKL